MSDAIIEALHIQVYIKHKFSLYSDELCRAERFLAKVKANEWLDFKTKSKYETKSKYKIKTKSSNKTK